MSLTGKSLPEKQMFPSSTAGTGRIRANSARTGKGQGKGSAKRMVKCRFCGFLVDSAKVDHSGGTESGNSGYGAVTKYADGHGEQTVAKNAGCPFCGSKNYLGEK